MAWAKSLNDNIEIDLFSSGVHGLVTTAELIPEQDAIKIDGIGNYAYGYLPLRELLAERYHVHSDQVMTSQGSSSANFLIAAAIFENPGGQALVELPCYQPLLGGIQGAGAQILRLERRFEDQYNIDLDHIKKT